MDAMEPSSPVGISDSTRTMLRHTLATLAYRGAKAVHGAPEGFAEFRIGDKSRTPGQILAHVSDLLDWGLSLAKGEHKWHDSEPVDWSRGTLRFFAALEAFDSRLGSDLPLECPPERLFQGPIADALTHVGQIAMLRRLAGAPVRGENYFRAQIAAGRVKSDQPAAIQEFD
jgi:hypothetical protein